MNYFSGTDVHYQKMKTIKIKFKKTFRVCFHSFSQQLLQFVLYTVKTTNDFCGVLSLGGF